MVERDILMVNQIALLAQENNAEIIVINLFLIKKLIIPAQLDMIQVILGIGKKVLILEYIEIKRL